MVEVSVDLSQQRGNGAVKILRQVFGRKDAIKRLKSLARDGVKNCTVCALLEACCGLAKSEVRKKITVPFGTAHSVAGLIHRHRIPD